MSSTWMVFIAFMFMDQLQGVGVSALVIAGKQNLGGLITWVGYFLIGIGSISFNVFVRQTQLAGIWIGATAAVSFNFVSFASVESSIDWHTFVVVAADRRKKELNSNRRLDTNDLRTRLLPEENTNKSI
jgi:hypothetical protein